MRERTSPETTRAKRGVSRWIAAAGFATPPMILTATPAAQAQDGARKILKAMSDYVAAQKALTLTYDSDIEVITSDLQSAVHRLGSGQLSRPDNFAPAAPAAMPTSSSSSTARRHRPSTGQGDVFAQVAAAGRLIRSSTAARRTLVEAPGADLLLSIAYEC